MALSQRKPGRKATQSGRGRAAEWASRRRKNLDYAARSAFKLLELDKQHRLLPTDGHVLDLGSSASCSQLLRRRSSSLTLTTHLALCDAGASPGAWLQVASERQKPNSKSLLVGVDLQPVDVGSLPRVHPSSCIFLRQGVEDLTMEHIRSATNGTVSSFSCVLSDLAPSTTGVKDADAGRSYELASAAVDLAFSSLRKNGNFCTKLLEGPGPGIKELERELKPHFKKVIFARPKATRHSSSEVYVIGKSFAPPEHGEQRQEGAGLAPGRIQCQ